MLDVCEYISFLPPVSCICTILYLHSLVFLFFYNPWFIYTNCTIVVFYIEINQDFFTRNFYVACMVFRHKYRYSYGMNSNITEYKLGLLFVLFCAVLIRLIWSLFAKLTNKFGVLYHLRRHLLFSTRIVAWKAVRIRIRILLSCGSGSVFKVRILIRT